jgi:hypothetical protein
VGGTTAATSMSCNSDKGRSAVAAKEAGEQLKEMRQRFWSISKKNLRKDMGQTSE